jgi:hypothetical protein
MSERKTTAADGLRSLGTAATLLFILIGVIAVAQCVAG